MAEHAAAKDRNNYENWCEQWRVRFLGLNRETLISRLPELTDEGEWLTLRHFGRMLGVNKTDGRIAAMEDSEPVSCYERLNLYTLFGYVSPLARFRDEWVKFDQLKGAAPFSKAFQAGVIEPFARTFDGHRTRLEQAMQKLNGRRLPHSDAGYEVDAFDCLPVRFLFWEGDDEFPAQGNILFDAGATDYIHVESIVTIASVGLGAISRKAGIPMDRSAFPIF